MADGIVDFLKNVGRGREQPEWRRKMLEQVERGEIPRSYYHLMSQEMPANISPAQTVWGAGLALPLTGIAEAAGKYPEPPAYGTSIYEMLTGPRTPSAVEHWQEGHPWIAGLQGVCAALPGYAYAKYAAGPVRRGIASLEGVLSRFAEQGGNLQRRLRGDYAGSLLERQLADLPDDASRREFLKNMGLSTLALATGVGLGRGLGRGSRTASTAARVDSRALPSSRPDIAGFHRLFSATKAGNVSQWDWLRALRYTDMEVYDVGNPSLWMSRNIDEGVDWAGMSERYGLGPDDFHILAVNTDATLPANTSVAVNPAIAGYSPELNTPIYENLFGRIDTSSIHLRPTNPVPDLVKPSHVQDFMEEVRGGVLKVDRFPRILDQGKVAIDEVMGVPVIRAGRRGQTGPWSPMIHPNNPRGGWGNHQLMIPTEQGLRKMELHRLRQSVGHRLAPETLQRLEGPQGYNTTARDMGVPLSERLSLSQGSRGYESGAYSFRESADVTGRNLLPLEVTRPSDRVGFTGVGPARSLPTGPTTSGLNPESLREADALREFYDLPLAK